METRSPERIKRRPCFYRGNGKLRRNQKALLDLLWEYTINNQVQYSQFEWWGQQFINSTVKNHLEDLQKLGCLKIIWEARGRGPFGIGRIELLRKDIPEKAPEAPQIKTEAIKLEPVAELDKKINGSGAQAHNETREEGKRSAFVFLDQSNLTGPKIDALKEIFLGQKSRNDAEEHRLMKREEVNWQELVKIIKAGPAGTGILPKVGSMDAFINCGRKFDYRARTIYDREKLWVWESDLMKSGFNLIYHPENVDVALATTMMDKAYRAFDDHQEVWLVLLSGDFDYVGTLEKIKNRAKELGISLSIWVIAWQLSLNKQLNRVADYYTEVESLLQQISPVGFARYNREMARINKAA